MKIFKHLKKLFGKGGESVTDASTDGYGGQWNPDPDSCASRGKWPIAVEHKLPTLTMVYRHGDGFFWTCVTCGQVIQTETYNRPKHTCEVDKTHEA